MTASDAVAAEARLKALNEDATAIVLGMAAGLVDGDRGEVLLEEVMDEMTVLSDSILAARPASTISVEVW